MELDPSVVAAIVGAFTGVGIVLLSQYFDRKRQIAEAHREKKAEMYTEFLALFLDLVQKHGRGELQVGNLNDDHRTRLVTFQRDLLLWASPSVVRAYRDLQDKRGRGSQFSEMETMLRAIRKDLRLHNFGFREYELLKLTHPDPQHRDLATPGRPSLLSTFARMFGVSRRV